jgi:hypothetical protein
MAVTQLSNLVIAPEVFAEQIVLNSLTLNAFIQSGVAIRDQMLDDFLTSKIGGYLISPRYLGPLPEDDANISSDDPTSQSTPVALAGMKNTAVRHALNNSWSSMDLVFELNGADPLAGIQSKIAWYWMVQQQRRILASLQGIIANNIASDSSDMVNDISGLSGTSNLFNGHAFIDTQSTMGDRQTELTALCVHSLVYGTMRKNDLITFRPDSEGKWTIPMYMGIDVVVDDKTTVVAGSPTKYYTYLFGPGAVAMGVGTPKVPFEIWRTPMGGNGGGQETIFSRVDYILHPQGFEYTLGEGPSPSVATLAQAATWSRSWERKRVMLACLISRG